MTPDEQLAHNAQDVAQAGEEFPYCATCRRFTTLTEFETCMRCGLRNVVWREIDAPERERKGLFQSLWRWLRE